MKTNELKKRFYEIGNSYSRPVLLGYISFFRKALRDARPFNKEYYVNCLRLITYMRIAREKKY